MASIFIHAQGATPTLRVRKGDSFFAFDADIPYGDRVTWAVNDYEQLVDLRDQLDAAVHQLGLDLEILPIGR